LSHLVPSSSFDFARVLLPGDRVMWPQGTGEPTGLSSALIKQLPELGRLTLVTGMLTSLTLESIARENVDFLCLNGAGGGRKPAAWSHNRIIPAHISAIPALISEKRIPVDVALVRARPTRDSAVWSLGVMVDFVHELVGAARVVIAELDERLPLTSDDALIQRARFTHVTEADGAEPMLLNLRPSATDLAVARRVAQLIPDRATLQLGVGGLPTAVCEALTAHKDLGLHSGVIPDAVVPLLESGVISNRYKGVDVGRTVTGGLFGTRRLFDHANGNDRIAMRRATYTHAARTHAMINGLYSINSAIELDLTGQCNAEVAGRSYVGAVGGQVDFVRGARLSAGGRAVMALGSATEDGVHSKIVASLGNRPVTTPRSDIDLVVTEYGVADLWGLDLNARAEALIAIAHPRFRDSLSHQLEEQRRQNSSENFWRF